MFITKKNKNKHTSREMKNTKKRNTMKTYKNSNSSNSKLFFNKEFPYYKYYITKNNIIKNVLKLGNYKPFLLKYNPISKKINKFNNKLVVFKEEYVKNKELYQITDYFSQSCRMSCLNNLKSKETPLEFFQKNKETIYKELKSESESDISYSAISEYLYKNTKQCTNFNTTVVISLLKFFKVKYYYPKQEGGTDFGTTSIDIKSMEEFEDWYNKDFVNGRNLLTGIIFLFSEYSYTQII